MWGVISFILTGVFYHYYFHVETSSQCLVEEGGMSPIQHNEVYQRENAKAVNVSEWFDQIIAMFLVNSLSLALVSIYNIVSIYLMPNLLKYETQIGMLS